MPTKENSDVLAELLTQANMIEGGVSTVVTELEHELRRTRVNKKDIVRHKKSLEATLAAIKDLQDLTVLVAQKLKTKTLRPTTGRRRKDKEWAIR